MAAMEVRWILCQSGAYTLRIDGDYFGEVCLAEGRVGPEVWVAEVYDDGEGFGQEREFRTEDEARAWLLDVAVRTSGGA